MRFSASASVCRESSGCEPPNLFVKQKIYNYVCLLEKLVEKILRGARMG